MKYVLRNLSAMFLVCALIVGMESSHVLASSPIAPTITDREALVSLYQATNGVNWLKSDNWLTNVPLDAWHGVTTDSSGRVIALDLSENELSGSIPSELGKLTELKELHLEENELSGSIPPELGKLTELKELHLEENELSGSIPPELGRLTELKELHLEENELSGYRQNWAAHQLKELHLGNGSVPIP